MNSAIQIANRVLALTERSTVLKIATLSTAILFAAVTRCQANHFDTGNDYWARCFGKENIICEATAGAYLDMMQTTGYQCSTDGVTRGQSKDVLMKFLADNPAQRNYTAASLAVVAFLVAFNCKVPAKQ